MAVTAPFSRKKVLLIVTGGKTRQESSYNGLVVLREVGVPLTTSVLIHNVANPFATKKDIDALLRSKSAAGTTLGQPVIDTIKEVTSTGLVKQTLPRASLRRIQTPQVAHLGLLLRAHETAKRRKWTADDDMELIERLGKKVKVVHCSEQNFKITTPQDLWIAKSIKNQATRKVLKGEERKIQAL